MVVKRENIDEELKRFWEIEESAQDEELTSEHSKCEDYYQKTTRRNRDGTYTVKLAFNDIGQSLGDSKPRAKARWYQMEKKFIKNRNVPYWLILM